MMRFLTLWTFAALIASQIVQLLFVRIAPALAFKVSIADMPKDNRRTTGALTACPRRAQTSHFPDGPRLKMGGVYQQPFACGKFGYVVGFCLLGPIPGFLIGGSFQLRAALLTAKRWCTPDRCILADDAGCPYSAFFCVESEPDTFITRFKVRVQDVAAGDFVATGVIDLAETSTHAACQDAGTDEVALLRAERNASTLPSSGAIPCWDSSTGCCSATQGAGPYVFGGVLLLLGVALLCCLCAIGRAARSVRFRLGDADVEGRLPVPPLTDEDARLAVEQWLEVHPDVQNPLGGGSGSGGAISMVHESPFDPQGSPAFEDSVTWSASERASAGTSARGSVDSTRDRDAAASLQQ
jgi:hypothetical protein